MDLEHNPFNHISIDQRDIFLNLLQNNDISYNILNEPFENIDGFYCNTKSSDYKNFKDFIDELNNLCVANIYLYNITIGEDLYTGELFYKIRYCVDKDIITYEILEEIKRIFNTIECNKNGMSTAKIKTTLKKFDISENAITIFVKLIRIIEKELKKDKND